MNKLNSFLLILQKYFIVKKPFSVINHNKFNIFSILKKSKIRINGSKNRIDINQGNFKKIKIGIDGNNNIILMEKDLFIRNLEIIIQGDNHTIYIGERTEIGGANIVCCGENSKISIGKDCLLASNIDLRSCDGHAIYQNNRIINNSKNIFISNNVWIAQNVNILKGANIGANSVVGMNSIVTSNNFNNNVIIAGVPAKVIKNNITWGKERTK